LHHAKAAVAVVPSVQSEKKPRVKLERVSEEAGFKVGFDQSSGEWEAEIAL
jgi:hypothetical protein